MNTLPQLTDPAAPPPTWRIPLDLIDPNPHQPRRDLDETALTELVASIRDHGLLQPISVRRVQGGRYQLIAGHRRLEAFRRLRADSANLTRDGAERFETIPAHEKFDVTDEEMALLALVENLQRDDLSPIDAALGLSRFQEAHQLSTEALCQRTGLEIDRAKRLLRLSRTPLVIQQVCHDGVLVEQRDEHGNAKVLPSGKPKHERIRLDLMAALEFAKLHAHVAKLAPKRADERTGRAIQRALAERWSFRRVQAFCRAAVTTSDAEPARHPDSSGGRNLALFTDGTELRIRRTALQSASPEERTALLGILRRLVEELAA
jgi:ParB/RepB/Spo0J family partition protein